MTAQVRPATGGSEPSFAELFTPKLLTVLREGYTLAHLKTDILAGLTVAIVALPLSMAIAIASGTSPDKGLYTAIVGGFLVSALGGSRFQIGGPAGAFIVLVALTVQKHGLDGLAIATIMAGIILLAIGFLRLGTYIKFIPYPVTVGFTAGIAVIIFASQIKDLLGLTLTVPEPGPLLDKGPVLWHALPTLNPSATALAVATIAVIITLKRVRPHWPGMLIMVVATSLAVTLFSLPVETIGTRFGGIASSLPTPHLPTFTLEKAQAVLPDAIAFALLGAFESLLSAVVADGMTGRRHRSNCELVAQGTANIASALFGGICVTGTIARTATNVRAGARGPVAGMVHSLFLLVFILVAAPLASAIPLACLAGVLAVVAWDMVERSAIAVLFRASRGEALVFSATFLLTIFRDLTEAIVVGFVLGAIIFINRMAKTIALEHHGSFALDDVADSAREARQPFDAGLVANPEVVVYRLSGAFFFGAASSVGSVLDRIADQHKALILDFSAVPFLDSTAAHTIGGVARKSHSSGVKLYITGTTPHIRRELLLHGVRPQSARFKRTVDNALQDLAHKDSRSADETAGSDPHET